MGRAQGEQLAEAVVGPDGALYRRGRRRASSTVEPPRQAGKSEWTAPLIADSRPAEMLEKFLAGGSGEEITLVHKPGRSSPVGRSPGLTDYSACTFFWPVQGAEYGWHEHESREAALADAVEILQRSLFGGVVVGWWQSPSELARCEGTLKRGEPVELELKEQSGIVDVFLRGELLGSMAGADAAKRSGLEAQGHAFRAYVEPVQPSAGLPGQAMLQLRFVPHDQD